MILLFSLSLFLLFCKKLKQSTYTFEVAFDTLGSIRRQVTKWRQITWKLNTQMLGRVQTHARILKMNKISCSWASKMQDEQRGCCLRRRVTCSMLGNQCLKCSPYVYNAFFLNIAFQVIKQTPNWSSVFLFKFWWR